MYNQSALVRCQPGRIGITTSSSTNARSRFTVMYGHPSAPLLLQLTQLVEDHETMEALAMENITIAQLLPLIDALEAVCDVSFRDD